MFPKIPAEFSDSVFEMDITIKGRETQELT